MDALTLGELLAKGHKGYFFFDPKGLSYKTSTPGYVDVDHCTVDSSVGAIVSTDQRPRGWHLGLTHCSRQDAVFVDLPEYFNGDQVLFLVVKESVAQTAEGRKLTEVIPATEQGALTILNSCGSVVSTRVGRVRAGLSVGELAMGVISEAFEVGDLKPTDLGDYLEITEWVGNEITVRFKQ